MAKEEEETEADKVQAHLPDNRATITNHLEDLHVIRLSENDILLWLSGVNRALLCDVSSLQM